MHVPMEVPMEVSMNVPMNVPMHVAINAGKRVVWDVFARYAPFHGCRLPGVSAAISEASGMP